MRLIETKEFCTTMKKVARVMGPGKPGKWCLIGGRAVEVYTNPPQSPDVDILFDATINRMPMIIRKFKTFNIVLVEEYEKDYIGFFVDEDNGVEVDVMPTYDPYEVEAIRLAEMTQCGEARFPVIGIEDLVIMKAGAAASEGGMMGRSQEKKLRDIKALLVLQNENDLDSEYIASIVKPSLMPREHKLLKKLGILK